MNSALPYRVALAAAALLSLAPSVGAGPAAGQTVHGVVAEQMSLAPVEGARVVLFSLVSEEALDPVASALTDPDGTFVLDAPGAGRYRVQADKDGLSTPLSPVLDLAGVGASREVVLTFPSTLLQSALTCAVDAGEGTAAVVGTVLDPDNDVPLSGTLVVASWQEDGVVRRLETEADGAGRYRLCPPGGAGAVTFQTYLLGRWENHGEVRIPGPSLVIHDLAIATPATRTADDDVIRERILQEAAALTLGDLRGQIFDRDTGAPLRFAEVGLLGLARRTVTDEAGRFSLGDLEPATYTLEIRSLGYEVVAEPVEVPAGMDVLLDLRVAPQAVEIDGLVVTARAAVEQAVRVAPFRRSIVYGEVMALEEQRGAMAMETLRRSAPGIRVRERYVEAAGRILCIETNRRIQSMTGGECANAAVIVDGIPIMDGPEFLLRTPASEIESIEFVTPVQAQILYGIGGNTSNGVVVVFTRGKGPYASPLRERGR